MGWGKGEGRGRESKTLPFLYLNIVPKYCLTELVAGIVGSGVVTGIDLQVAELGEFFSRGLFKEVAFLYR